MKSIIYVVGLGCFCIMTAFSCTKEAINKTEMDTSPPQVEERAYIECCSTCEIEVEMNTFGNISGGTLYVYMPGQYFCNMETLVIPPGQEVKSGTIDIRGRGDGPIEAIWAPNNSVTTLYITKFDYTCQIPVSLDDDIDLGANTPTQIGHYQMCKVKEDYDNSGN